MKSGAKIKQRGMRRGMKRLQKSRKAEDATIMYEAGMKVSVYSILRVSKLFIPI